MATVLLVRHGVTAATGRRAGGRTDAELSDDGRAQAEAVARRLATTRLSGLYASPIVRARQTAEAIGRSAGREVVEVEGLQELDHGRWTDRPFEQMRRTKHFAEVVRRPSRVALPEGESFVAAQGRAASATEEIVASHPDRATVVLVSHADVVKLLVAHYVGMPLDAFQRIVVSPASVTTLVVPRRGDARLVGLNDVAHLEAAR